MSIQGKSGNLFEKIIRTAADGKSFIIRKIKWNTFTFITKIIIMPLLTVLLVLIVVGVVLWLVNNYIPMDGKIKQIINAVVVIAVVVWLIQLFVGPIPDLRVGR